MNYYNLDKVSWEHSQALYHAAAYLQREALFILRPATPYVCIGFHQDAEQEIDLEFTRRNRIPVFRREVGGGAVYLDGNQLFFQLVLKKERPELPENKADFYRKFLVPVIDTYREFGVPAEYKPVNDIIANGRKVSGTGAAELNDMIILVGNFIQDFDYEMMSKCLRVPDEKFRDKVYKTLQENLSTFKREIGTIPSNQALGDALAARYESILGPMTHQSTVEADLVAFADAFFNEHSADDWLLANDHRRLDARQVKIREGVYVIQNMLKTPGGLIRVTAIADEGLLRDIHISGDFFFYPAEELGNLEVALAGVKADRDAITKTVSSFFEERKIEAPGVLAGDFANVLVPDTV